MFSISKYSFHGQQPDETVRAVFKRHPWSYLKSALKLLIFLLIPWVVFLFSGFSRPFSIISSIVGIIGIIWAALIIYLWNANIVILTDKRVMIVDLKNPISRQVTEVPLKNIQDSFFESRGLLKTIFGYGDIILQTAGSRESNIVLKNLDAPYDVQQLISRTIKQ